jgi:hypothetical protein
MITHKALYLSSVHGWWKKFNIVYVIYQHETMGNHKSSRNLHFSCLGMHWISSNSVFIRNKYQIFQEINGFQRLRCTHSVEYDSKFRYVCIVIFLNTWPLDKWTNVCNTEFWGIPGFKSLNLDARVRNFIRAKHINLYITFCVLNKSIAANRHLPGFKQWLELTRYFDWIQISLLRKGINYLKF